MENIENIYIFENPMAIAPPIPINSIYGCRYKNRDKISMIPSKIKRKVKSKRRMVKQSRKRNR